MSRDLKVIGISSEDIHDPELKWDFFDYVNIPAEEISTDLHLELIDDSNCYKFIREGDDHLDELLVFDSYMYAYKDLLELLHSYSDCYLKEQLLSILEEEDRYPFILLQPF